MIDLRHQIAPPDVARFRDLALALADEALRAFPNHRIYRSSYTHLCAAAGQVDAMVDVGNVIWDIAAARILVEEAGGACRVVQDYASGPERIISLVFGRPSVVERLAAFFARPA